MKRCAKCKIEKFDKDFYLDKRTKSGLQSQCKICLKEDMYRPYIAYQSYGIGINTIKRLGLKNALFVYDRDKRKCTICNSEFDLTVDHIDGNGRHNLEKGLPMNNNPDNLRLLCRKCHGSISFKVRKIWPKKYKLEE